MNTQQYLDSINKRYKLGNSTEHTFRGDLQQLLESLVPAIRATNEPKRQKCGAPDYILTKKDIPVGFIEAKDIGDTDLEGTKKTGNKEQFDRYKTSLHNLIFTDYVRFHFYSEGICYATVDIAELTDKGIKSLPENFSQFENLIQSFCSTIGQTIKSSKKLSEMMAGKARLLSDIIEKSLSSDNSNNEDSTLKDQMEAFKQILIHDITPKSFADVYAQTIVYGMFAARLHDPTLDTFSRQEAYELIPKSNPFLKKLFGYIAGLDVDDRIRWIVDDLVQIFLACNVSQLLKDYGKGTKMEDPIIHFYEDFLADYDPALRKARGVWYTPAPVVNFIVRAVDDILKTEFDLPQGLADTSKIKIKTKVQGNNKEQEQEVHRVQILDPATGTGTFLAEVVKLIHKKFEKQQGLWSNYVENHLLPRLNGFELLMASYAMAHLKLDLLLTETGYKPSTDVARNVSAQRLRVYLTNSLEEHHPDTGTLFANWLSTEANEANRIKRDTPVMCIIGNPPYSGESSNKGEWIMNLMEDYKKEPEGKEKLKEKNSKWINDDYVKFLRFGQHFIEKNGSGILAYINPHGFLDNPTFRGMRWNLLKTYDKIYTIDLHGNSKKSEVSIDGSVDQNVFDIMQGVSINIFIKTGKKKNNELGEIFHFDLFGKREYKYDYLINNSIKSVTYKALLKREPEYFFVPKDYNIKGHYDKGFKLSDFFIINGNGIVTKRDELCIQDNIEKCFTSINDIITLDKNVFYQKYKLPEDVRDWRYEWAKDDVIKSGIDRKKIKTINYRPFDKKYIYYSGKSRGFVGWPVEKIMKNYFFKDNYGLLCPKAFKDDSFSHVFITQEITEAIFLSSQTGSNAMNFPLYIYSDNKSNQDIFNQSNIRTPNLKADIINKIAKNLNLTFTPEKETTENTFAPIDILDYIYAVLHSPTYREKYKEFLKIDFPRVPYPKDATTFWQLVKLGGEIRQIHLLESPTVEKYITQYPEDGTNIVDKIRFEMYVYEAELPNENGEIEYPDYLGSVYINDTQYFADVPLSAWEFYIGGYQPAQKWLKDRKGRTLSVDDILHYQKIIVALSETARIMKEINKIEIEKK